MLPLRYRWERQLKQPGMSTARRRVGTGKTRDAAAKRPGVSRLLAADTYAPAADRFEEATVTAAGITDHAAQALGDVVYVDLPAVGSSVTAGEPCGEVESTKSVSDLYSPVTGEVTAVNEALADDPSAVNTDPYGAGWMFTVATTATGETMDAAAYSALIEG